MAEWVELGRRVFYEYPLRPEIFAEHALRNPEVAREVGLQPAADGSWPGVVAFGDIDGTPQIGITCALCHVATEDGVVVEGRARRNLDYGRMRLAYHRDTGAPLPEDLARRMASWGRGRADITQDEDEDPVAIVDLWGVRRHAFLTQAATLQHVHPAALAIRQETQILHANRERTRPPRELAWALAMFVYALQPPPRATVVADPKGRELFGTHCARCHNDENLGGLPIPAERIGTDQRLANGRARGTGLYRPSPLVRVAEAAPYFHNGTVPTLAAVLDPARLADVPGHAFGTSLPADDRRALLDYLVTL
jgi:cytochrome c5